MTACSWKGRWGNTNGFSVVLCCPDWNEICHKEEESLITEWAADRADVSWVEKGVGKWEHGVEEGAYVSGLLGRQLR